MPLAEPPLELLPDPDAPGWRRLTARWRRCGVVVGHAEEACWGTGRTGSRALVAATVGHLLELPAERVALERDHRRRPYPVDRETGRRLPVDLNLSHTDDLFLLGVSRNGRIGVDVERADRDIAPGPRMLARVCHPGERDALAELSRQARTEAVARLWVCKEAVAKADGRGLLLDLSTVRADVPPPGWRLATSRLPSSRTAAGYWIGAALREGTAV
ncbi:4'-phosphopantetheinyl transferase family protein [Streptomyces alkaliterrae]|uniref:4'-phosphopantetheinyl transferase superfamily protein n=1 Tax=Streptomyces alkaliterrae TaxID=2213162 RepID=A0A5P0YU88_9ACTN|nr:4'-phosphopantetheinyl transferase superfamily protein [Streptomyces alkaliterrae]MBB1256110.1 4'-phosphopantetheinyl transferase superfamily protein [Streptomyces alkaliterrae]MBB1259116.1 4'-phosphopantetheinyl transferase superfamily protein [Streptomyces alkaliterrae]MQS03876.1 4'-phosphopantetheinyl transferase superfamily protein [Streptomyces alkaliterrae]